MPLRSTLRSLLAITTLGLAGCASLHRNGAGSVQSREIPVYRAVAESLYLSRAGGRSIGLVTELLDTACAERSCLPISKRWGLDSLWWSRDDAALAATIKGALLARAGQAISFGPEGIGNSRIVPFDADSIDALGADVDRWRAFQQRSSTVAVLRFSPVGFSRDGSRALVLVRMRCGIRCGHLLGASLTKGAGRWTIADLLLIDSDR
jgi:hypothetical protein